MSVGQPALMKRKKQVRHVAKHWAKTVDFEIQFSLWVALWPCKILASPWTHIVMPTQEWAGPFPRRPQRHWVFSSVGPSGSRNYSMYPDGLAMCFSPLGAPAWAQLFSPPISLCLSLATGNSLARCYLRWRVGTCLTWARLNSSPWTVCPDPAMGWLLCITRSHT